MRSRLWATGWSDARENDVFEHAGARDVIRREDFAKTGATTMREVLNRILALPPRKTTVPVATIWR